MCISCSSLLSSPTGGGRNWLNGYPETKFTIYRALCRFWTSDGFVTHPPQQSSQHPSPDPRDPSRLSVCFVRKKGYIGIIDFYRQWPGPSSLVGDFTHFCQIKSYMPTYILTYPGLPPPRVLFHLDRRCTAQHAEAKIENLKPHSPVA